MLENIKLHSRALLMLHILDLRLGQELGRALAALHARLFVRISIPQELVLAVDEEHSPNSKNSVSGASESISTISHP